MEKENIVRALQRQVQEGDNNKNNFRRKRGVLQTGRCGVAEPCPRRGRCPSGFAISWNTLGRPNSSTAFAEKYQLLHEPPLDTSCTCTSLLTCRPLGLADLSPLSKLFRSNWFEPSNAPSTNDDDSISLRFRCCPRDAPRRDRQHDRMLYPRGPFGPPCLRCCPPSSPPSTPLPTSNIHQLDVKTNLQATPM